MEKKSIFLFPCILRFGNVLIYFLSKYEKKKKKSTHLNKILLITFVAHFPLYSVNKQMSDVINF